MPEDLRQSSGIIILARPSLSYPTMPLHQFNPPCSLFFKYPAWQDFTGKVDALFEHESRLIPSKYFTSSSAFPIENATWHDERIWRCPPKFMKAFMEGDFKIELCLNSTVFDKRAETILENASKWRWSLNDEQPLHPSSPTFLEAVRDPDNVVGWQIEPQEEANTSLMSTDMMTRSSVTLFPFPPRQRLNRYNQKMKVCFAQ